MKEKQMQESAAFLPEAEELTGMRPIVCGTLYYADAEDGFSEEKSVALTAALGGNAALAVLPERACFFRFVPAAECGCICRNVMMQLGSAQLRAAGHNAVSVADWDVFTTDKPFYLFVSETDGQEKALITGEIVSVDVSLFPSLNSMLSVLREREQQQTQLREELIRAKEEVIGAKAEALSAAEREKLWKDEKTLLSQFLSQVQTEKRRVQEDLTGREAALSEERSAALRRKTEYALQLENIAGERDAYRNEVFSLQKHIAETHKSISWRVAAPIRWMGQLLRRQKKAERAAAAAEAEMKALWEEFSRRIDETDYDYLDIFPVPMGWNTPLFQRFQHISLQAEALNGISFYGAHPKVDPDVKTYRFLTPHLCLVNLDDPEVVYNFWRVMDKKSGLRMIRVQSIDLVTSMAQIKRWISTGYQVVYEYIDEITPQITGKVPEQTVRRHEMILHDESVTIIATSDKLYRQAAEFRRSNILMLNNGVDYAHWHISPDEEDCPEDLKPALAKGKLVVGYHGALAQWVDYALLKRIADDGRYTLVLIGFAHDESLKASGLTEHKNVFFLGAKKYTELNRYAAYYDIGILPFVINDITLSVSPVKIFEYMAAGKPVVSYALPECKKYRSCFCAEDAEEFMQLLETAAAKRTDKDYLALLDADALANTWETITRRMVEFVREHESRETGDHSGGIVLSPALTDGGMERYMEDLLRQPNYRDERDYRPLTRTPYAAQPGDCKVIAYYLTQYHPDAHNELWWGRGVTEWNNVSRAVPQYVGHYQPRLPGELGYYDLRIKENMQRQIELARMYGIYGFSFYYYWFNGERLLEKPLEAFLAAPELDFPFSLCWANENWTRRFDGTNTDILMEQPKSVSSYKNVIEDMVRFLRDVRYIEIDGKKLLTVYRPSLMPECAEVLEHWRRYVRRSGLGELYIMAVKENGVETDWLSKGYDAITEFHPGTLYYQLDKINAEKQFVRSDFSGEVFSYADIVENRKYFRYDYPKLYRAVMPMWDNTARRDNKGMIFDGAEPRLYKQWLKDVIEDGKKRGDLEDNMIFINAWNEWGEGAYLEPDKRYGYAYLQATKEAVEECRDTPAAEA